MTLMLACGSEPTSRSAPAENEAAAPAGMSEIEWGEWLFTSYGCTACHSVAGAEGIGPPLDDIAGTDRAQADGTTALADTSYLRTALLDPSEHVPAGYAPRMLDYELSYAQVDALVAYLNHLGGVTVATEDE